MPRPTPNVKRPPRTPKPAAQAPSHRATRDVAMLLAQHHGHHLSTLALYLAREIKDRVLDSGTPDAWQPADYEIALQQLVSMLDALDHRRTHLDARLGGKQTLGSTEIFPPGLSPARSGKGR